MPDSPVAKKLKVTKPKAPKKPAGEAKKKAPAKKAPVKKKAKYSDEDDISSYAGSDDDVPKASPEKQSIEQIYQKKTQLEHILLRPDTYGASRVLAGVSAASSSGTYAVNSHTLCLQLDRLSP